MKWNPASVLCGANSLVNLLYPYRRSQVGQGVEEVAGDFLIVCGQLVPSGSVFIQGQHQSSADDMQFANS